MAISVSGHSGYDEAGKDIVCAAASTLIYTAIGALEDICGFKDFYSITEDGDSNSVPLAEIEIPKADGEYDRIAQTIVKTVEIGFAQLEQSAKEFIRMDEIVNK